MVGFLQRSIVAAAVMAAALAGCSAGQLGDTLPNSMGGLPEGAPARPNTTRQFPAVHDMPAQRPTTPLTAEDQLKPLPGSRPPARPRRRRLPPRSLPPLRNRRQRPLRATPKRLAQRPTRDKSQPGSCLPAERTVAPDLKV